MPDADKTHRCCCPWRRIWQWWHPPFLSWAPAGRPCHRRGRWGHELPPSHGSPCVPQHRCTPTAKQSFRTTISQKPLSVLPLVEISERLTGRLPYVTNDWLAQTACQHPTCVMRRTESSSCIANQFWCSRWWKILAQNCSGKDLGGPWGVPGRRQSGWAAARRQLPCWWPFAWASHRPRERIRPGSQPSTAWGRRALAAAPAAAPRLNRQRIEPSFKYAHSQHFMAEVRQVPASALRLNRQRRRHWSTALQPWTQWVHPVR